MRAWLAVAKALKCSIPLVFIFCIPWIFRYKIRVVRIVARMALGCMLDVLSVVVYGYGPRL